ncbi:MAG: PDDEXK nuclease domain-containing protein [Verrucomicrobiales bacterium]
MTKPTAAGSAKKLPAGVGKATRTLLPEIRSLIENARHSAAASANLSMVALYWNIGRVIATEVQEVPSRASYGSQVIARLAEILAGEYGRGFSAPNLWDMRRFFAAFQILQTPSGVLPASLILQTVSRESLAAIENRQTLPAESTRTASTVKLGTEQSADRLEIDFTRHLHLGWSHYRLLLAQSDPHRRRFYFAQAATQRWSTRELTRQIARALFERVALSRDTRKLVAAEKAISPPEIASYRDAFKDPYLLDFLGLTGAYSEKDLEGRIIHNLQKFLSELGNDFAFLASQFRIRIDADDYFLDLLFYHRGLRCLVAIDLKIGAFTAADKGQMDLYLSWLKQHEWREGENEPVGLILCTSKKKQHVELLLAHGPHKMQVSEYLTLLPDKRVLEERLRIYSELLQEGDQL